MTKTDKPLFTWFLLGRGGKDRQRVDIKKKKIIFDITDKVFHERA